MRRWNDFWFEDVPPHLFALLRIAFGVLGLLEVLGPTPLDMFWPADGIVPLPGSGTGLRAWLVAHELGAVAGYGLYAALVASFVAMTVGVSSGVAVSACFLGVLFQIQWNPLPLSSAHQVLAVMLFCLMWADTGVVWSVDAWRAERRAPMSTGPHATQPRWPLRLMQCQLVVIYMCSGMWKFFGPAWRDGSAVFYALSNNVFHRFPTPLPPESASFLAVATYVTLAFELGFGVLLWHTWTRRFALVAGVVLHLGLWITMELGLFSWFMIASYLAFISPDRVARWSARTKISSGSITADPHAPFIS